MLHIVFKITLEFDPAIVDKLQVLIIELGIEHSDPLIVENPIAMELILLPLPFIGYFVALVVQNPSSFHLILAPLSAVFPSFFVVKSTEAMAIFPEFVTFKASLLELLSNVYQRFSNP